MDKSPDAFRTISEVADHLETPAHVLRFWESRFPQIRPVKRAGGRRYYRPADVALLMGIKRLLHEEGLTIRGVQKILREQGVRHVAGLAGEAEEADSDLDAEAALEAALAANFGLLDEGPAAEEAAADPATESAAESATVVALETALRRPAPARRAAPDAATPSLFDQDSTGAAAAGPEISVFQPPYMASLPDMVRLAAEAEAEAEAAPAPLPPAGALADRLRALPAGALAGQQTRARILRQRLLALQARLLAGS